LGAELRQTALTVSTGAEASAAKMISRIE